MLKKMAISKLWSEDFEKKWVWKGAYYPIIFWLLKKYTIIFNFRSNEPSPEILGPLGQYGHPWKKIQK